MDLDQQEFVTAYFENRDKKFEDLDVFDFLKFITDRVELEKVKVSNDKKLLT